MADGVFVEKPMGGESTADRWQFGAGKPHAVQTADGVANLPPEVTMVLVKPRRECLDFYSEAKGEGRYVAATGKTRVEAINAAVAKLGLKSIAQAA